MRGFHTRTIARAAACMLTVLVLAALFSLDFNCRLFAKNYRHPVLVA